MTRGLWSEEWQKKRNREEKKKRSRNVIQKHKASSLRRIRRITTRIRRNTRKQQYRKTGRARSVCSSVNV